MIRKTFINSISEVSGSTMNTIIGKDTTITGTLDVKGALRVDGTVKGKVICNDCITIGATGLVEADLESATAVVAGRLVGNILSADKIELQAKCEMEGDIKTKSLVIEQGAMFSGACNMKEGRSNLGFLPSEEKKLELSAVQPEKRKLPF
jgi:cytoskeletal protein CcmA (bactofilin family)